MRFLAELYRGMLFKWKGANKKSHQKWDFIVNLGLWLVKKRVTWPFPGDFWRKTTTNHYEPPQNHHRKPPQNHHKATTNHHNWTTTKPPWLNHHKPLQTTTKPPQTTMTEPLWTTTNHHKSPEITTKVNVKYLSIMKVAVNVICPIQYGTIFSNTRDLHKGI